MGANHGHHQSDVLLSYPIPCSQDRCVSHKENPMEKIYSSHDCHCIGNIVIAVLRSWRSEVPYTIHAILHYALLIQLHQLWKEKSGLT